MSDVFMPRARRVRAAAASVLFALAVLAVAGGTLRAPVAYANAAWPFDPEALVSTITERLQELHNVPSGTVNAPDTAGQQPEDAQAFRDAPMSGSPLSVLEEPAATAEVSLSVPASPAAEQTASTEEPVQTAALAATLTEGENLVANGSLEAGTTGAPTGWSKGKWGTLTAGFSYPVTGYDGGKAAQVRVSNYANGDAKWVFAHVAVRAGERYVYEDRYKSTAQTSIVAEYKKGDGTLEYAWFNEAPVSSAWTSFRHEFVVPTGVVSLSVFHLLARNGTLVIDDVRLSQAGGTTPPPTPSAEPMVSITFDDAWLSQFQNALPVLDAYGVKGTFYITTNHINGWEGFMSKTQVKDLHMRGHEIGSHSVSHPHMTTLAIRKLRAELTNSRNTLQTLIGAPVRSLAYPYGEYDQRVIDETKKAGYGNARTVEAGQNTASTDPYKLRSLSPTNATPLSDITLAIDQAVAEGGWVTIALHKIDESGEEYSNSPEFLRAILEHCKEANVKVVTVSEGLASY